MPPLIAAFLVVLLEALAFGAVFPVIAYYCDKLGGTALAVGLMFAVVNAPRVVTLPLFGRLSDRVGRRPILILSTLGTLTGSIGWALAPSIAWLVAARAVTGVLGAQAGLAQAIAADVSPPERRAAAVGLLGAAFGIALSIGPAIGGIVAEHWSAAMVGWVCAGMQFTSLTIIVFFLRETRPTGAPQGTLMPEPPAEADVLPYAHTADQAGPVHNTRSLQNRRYVMLLQFVTLVMAIALAQLTITYPLATEHVYHFTEAQTGLALACVGLVGAAVQGGAIRTLVQHFGERATFATGIALTAIAFAALALLPSLVGFWTATVLLAIGMSLAMPCLSGLLSRSVGASEQGAVLGFNQGLTNLGRGTGALLAGWLSQQLGVPSSFVAAAVLLGALLPVFLPYKPPIPAVEELAVAEQSEARGSER